jgi:hypothetical protein
MTHVIKSLLKEIMPVLVSFRYVGKLDKIYLNYIEIFISLHTVNTLLVWVMKTIRSVTCGKIKCVCSESHMKYTKAVLRQEF